MSHLRGEFDCKVDAKGRMRLPGALVKQIRSIAEEGFILKKGLDNCLELFPLSFWNEFTKSLDNLSYFNRQERGFDRIFRRGLTDVDLDSADRILIPKRLMDEVGISGTVTITALGNRIEIWSPQALQEFESALPDDLSAFGQEVMNNNIASNSRENK